MSANYLLLSDEIIKERSQVHGNTDPQLLYPAIKIAQDNYILPILGTALYKKLQDAVNDGSWTGLDDYKYLLDTYIIDCLLWYSLSEAVVDASFQFWNKGIVRKIGENTELPSMSELIDISNRHRDRGQQYGTRLREYLIENAAAKFPEYNNPGNGRDTIHPSNKTFEIPIYLGDDDDCCDRPNKPYGQ